MLTSTRFALAPARRASARLARSLCSRPADAFQAVRWDDGHVAHSTRPDIDARVAEQLRLSEYMMGSGWDAAEGADKVSIYVGDAKQRTRKQLDADVQCVGVGLRDEWGVRPRDTVAVMLRNGVEFYSCLHGALMLGAVVTPVNTASTPEEMAQQLADSGARLIMADSDLEEVAKAGAALAEAETGRKVDVLSTGREWHQWCEARPDDAVVERLPPTPATADDTAYLPYSSGTTGRPKGVMLSHANIVNNMLQAETIESTYMDENDVVISPLPFSHIYGFLAALHIPLKVNATLITMARFDLEQFLQLIEKRRATRAHVVPPILLALSKSPLVDKYDLSSLKTIVSAAAPLGPDLEGAVEARLGCKVKQLWGMSELSPLGTGNCDAFAKAGTVGAPVASTSAKIVCVDSGKALPPGEEGELVVRGPQVMKGYLGAPDKTLACLDEHGWLRTGDIAIMDTEGFVTITDRAKELIKFKGYQVAPAELEDVLLSHPAVLDSCVIPVPDEAAGELPRAYVVVSPGHEASDDLADEIVAYVASRVSRHKHLAGGVAFCEAIPKTESGKLLRRKVVEMDRAARA